MQATIERKATEKTIRIPQRQTAAELAWEAAVRKAGA